MKPVNQKPPYWRLEGSGWQPRPPTTRLAVWRSRGPLGSSARYPRRNRNPAYHQARIHGNGRRISPDLGSGMGISYEAQFTLAMIQMDTFRKTADQPFLNDMSGISPKTVSHSENTPPRICKKNISRDTEQHLPSPTARFRK